MFDLEEFYTQCPSDITPKLSAAGIQLAILCLLSRHVNHYISGGIQQSWEDLVSFIHYHV